MKHSILSAISFSVVIFISSCGGNSSTSTTENKETVHTTTEKEFKDFWPVFRKAVLENNTNELSKRVRLPFMVLGPMDSDEAIMYKDFTAFNTMFQDFLNSPTGLNPNNLDETQKQYIQATETITFNENKLPMRTDTTASVSSMGFANENKGWQLVMVYLDGDNYIKFSSPAQVQK